MDTLVQMPLELPPHCHGHIEAPHRYDHAEALNAQDTNESICTDAASRYDHIGTAASRETHRAASLCCGASWSIHCPRSNRPMRLCIDGEGAVDGVGPTVGGLSPGTHAKPHEINTNTVFQHFDARARIVPSHIFWSTGNDAKDKKFRQTAIGTIACM